MDSEALLRDMAGPKPVENSQIEVIKVLKDIREELRTLNHILTGGGQFDVGARPTSSD